MIQHGPMQVAICSPKVFSIRGPGQWAAMAGFGLAPDDDEPVVVAGGRADAVVGRRKLVGEVVGAALVEV